MALVGSAKLNGTALELTDGNTNEAAAGWYNVPVNVQSFTNDFSFTITPAVSYIADGFTFTIQNAGTTALGPAGGGLGYGPDSPTGTAASIATSVALKFDLYSNAGEGADSTGLYINGASPTTPALDMTGTGIDLHSGHQFQVHMTYDGANLTMTITDISTNATFTHAWSINIPQMVGGNTAYVGFTAGTGGLVATQQILSWTYTTSTTTQPTLTSIAVTPANPSAAAGAAAQFHATGTYSDNSAQDITTSVTWASSNTSVAAVSSSGLANALAAGTSAISAASGSVSGSTTLTVTAATATSGSTINYSSGFSSTGLAFNGQRYSERHAVAAYRWRSERSQQRLVHFARQRAGLYHGLQLPDHSRRQLDRRRIHLHDPECGDDGARTLGRRPRLRPRQPNRRAGYSRERGH